MSADVSARLEEEDLPEIDVLGRAFQDDELAILRKARTHGTLARSRRGIEVLDYETVAALVSDDRLDSQDAGVYARMGGPHSLLEFAEDGLLVAMSGEKHKRIRRVFSTAFRVRHVQSLRPLMRLAAQDLIRAWDGGSCEFIRDFSSPFPMHVLCRLLGVPVEDIPLFTAAATELHLLAAVPLAPGFPRIDRALQTISEYITGLVRRRRAEPRDDIVTSLIAVQESEGRLTDTELTWNLVNLIFAGQDTTRYQLASVVRAVVQAPGAWERLAADPDLVPAAVAEGLRLYPVTRFIVRIPRDDLTVGDLHVRGGRRVILNLLAASRDPGRFESPDEFLLPRSEPHFNVPFGWGMHHCLGARLARAEIEEALRVLTESYRDVRITGVPAITPPAGMLHGPESMTLQLKKRA